MVSRGTDKHCLTDLWSIAPKGNFSLDCHREDGSQAETECSMSQQANKNLVARYYDEMWNKWNFALVDELLAKEISFRGSLGTETHGRTAVCNYMRRVQGAFPDFRNEIDEMIAQRNRVFTRLTYTGTHRGEIFDVVPTGRKVSYAGAAFYRIENSQVAQGWVLGDLTGLLAQLGHECCLKPQASFLFK
jgi:steroid delta-isomerase-like uncharacterized protein